jgi:hypothetical protein
MSDYLDGYGKADARRGKLIKRILISFFIVLIVGAVLYFQFRDYSEERQVKAFLEHLRNKDYQSAYALWGCSPATPCPQYVLEEFMKDWGPESPFANASAAEIAGKRSCEGGVIEFLQVPGKSEAVLFVDRKSDHLSFAPWRIKEIPDGVRHKLASWMWSITRNCKPLIEP